MRILIVGPPKTGTTGLFYKIGHSVEREGLVEMFEPPRYEGGEPDGPGVTIAKILIGVPYEVDFDSFSVFEKKIGLVRDPRDWVISSLLYGIFNAPFCEDDQEAGKVLDLLRKKEADPGKVSVLEIIRLMRSLPHPSEGDGAQKIEGAFLSLPLIKGVEEHYRWRMEMVSDFFRQHPGYYLVKYEDFVSGKLTGLEEYLGFALKGEEEIDPQFQRVIRTKGAGDWRNWFMEEDVAFFEPIFARFMEEFGYAPDWTLPEKQVIWPEHGSDYVRSLIAERKAITLEGDPDGVKRLLQRTRKTFKTFYSRHLPNVGANRQELEKEMDELQVAMNVLMKQLKRAEGAGEKLAKATEQLDATKAQLKAAKTKAEQDRRDCRRMRESISWRLTKPLRSVGKWIGGGKK